MRESIYKANAYNLLH